MSACAFGKKNPCNYPNGGYGTRGHRTTDTGQETVCRAPAAQTPRPGDGPPLGLLRERDRWITRLSTGPSHQLLRGSCSPSHPVRILTASLYLETRPGRKTRSWTPLPPQLRATWTTWLPFQRFLHFKVFPSMKTQVTMTKENVLLLLLSVCLDIFK